MQRRWSPPPRDAEATASAKPSELRASLRTLLRDATRREQRNVDRALAVLDLTERGDYQRFLCVHYAALGSLANKWREADRADFEAMLDCLTRDLRALGSSIQNPAPGPHRNLAMSLRTWGVGYVIRASRSSCRLRRNRVAAGVATSYLDFSPQIAWPQFLLELELDVRSHQPHEVDQVIRGARTALSAFGSAAFDQIAAPEKDLELTLR